MDLIEELSRGHKSFTLDTQPLAIQREAFAIKAVTTMPVNLEPRKLPVLSNFNDWTSSSSMKGRIGSLIDQSNLALRRSMVIIY